jgi:DNA-3-methyladenine glycosylase I
VAGVYVDLYKNTTIKNWGVLYDDAHLLCLNSLFWETFQAGLSWIILNKENFRKAFDNFDYKIIAKYSEDKIQALLDWHRSFITNSKYVLQFQTLDCLYERSGKNLAVFQNTFDSRMENQSLTTLKLLNVPTTTPLSD